MTRFIALIGLWTMAASLGGCAAIFNVATCNSPVGRDPPQSQVSVFVVPFEANTSSAVTEKAAAESARLFKVESIKANYGSDQTSVTLLRRGAFDRPCDAQAVADAVSESQRRRWNRLPSDSLMIWGIVVKRDDVLVSQLYSSILWNEPEAGQVKLNIGTGTDRTLHFTAQFPDLVVAFPQKPIGTSVNEEFVVDAEGRGIPRANPARNAVAVDLPTRFTVGEKRDGWIPLESSEGKVVWLDAIPVKGDGSARLFPEVDYFSALSAFIKWRGAGLDESRAKGRLAGLLRDYERQYGRATDDDSRTLLAMAHLLVAFQAMPARVGDVDDLTPQARQDVQAAAALLPDNAEIASLAAVASMQDCCAGRDTAARAATVQRHFDRALALDPASDLLLHNLDNWYALCEQRGFAPEGLTREQVHARRADIQKRLRTAVASGV